MMDLLIVVGSALWLGVLTSISPCPLATNIAAVSFLARKITHPAAVFLSGLSYTLGRMTAYAALGWVIVHSLLSVPEVAQFLQKYMVRALGPLLIVTGLFLLGSIRAPMPSIGLSEKNRTRLVEAGSAGAFLLGLIFALAFCPVSAALFFGSLVPLAIQSRTGTLLPFVYGMGTGLPVLAFAVSIALGVTSLSRWFRRIAKLEYYMRRVTGAVFILVGSYYSGIYLLRLF